MAAADEFVHRVRADETGAARDKVPHSRNPPSSCDRPAADHLICGRQVAAAAIGTSREKTPSPRFDTLVVRGEPAKRPDDFRARIDIVRRKRGGQAADSRQGHTKSMTNRVTIGVTALAALGCAAGAFFLVRARGEHPVPEVIASEPPGFREALPANKPGTDAAARSPSHAKSKKTPPPLTQGCRCGRVRFWITRRMCPS